MKRDEIILNMTSLCKSDLHGCNNVFESLNYYDEIYKRFQNKEEYPFDVIPLVWYCDDPCGWKSKMWLLLEEFSLEDDILYAFVSNYHSGPPDYQAISIDIIPTEILSNALKILKLKTN